MGSGYFVGRVDEDAAAAFALATNDHNELYQTGRATPPLFTASLVLAASVESQHRGGEHQLVKDARGSVHGEHDVLFHQPVRPGMPLRWRANNHGVKQTKGGVVVTQRILVTDIEGTPLVEHFWSNFHIGGRVASDLGRSLMDHTFPDGARSRPIGSRTIPVARDQGFRYAGVSGDHAPHAMDDEMAREEGYPSKILQGMCTFGLCSGALVDIGAGGDVFRLRRLAGRFSAPAFPGCDLVVNAYDAGRTPEGNMAVAFDAVQTSEGIQTAVVKHGRAEFHPI